MNYLEAREFYKPGQGGSKKWHYTCLNGKKCWPVGYCAQSCPGHDTAEQACDHHRNYLLDNAKYDLGSDSTAPYDQHKCQVEGCVNPTGKYAMIFGDHYLLCGQHMNRDALATFFSGLFTSIKS